MAGMSLQCKYLSCRRRSASVPHSIAGGYHPVRLGEKFKQGRYVVLKKLGWGHFSTVWLVLDTHTHTFAALKASNLSASMAAGTAAATPVLHLC